MTTPRTRPGRGRLDREQSNAAHPPRLVLASRSPARLSTLRRAGIEPEVVVSGVDESCVAEADPTAYACALARLKCRTVAEQTGPDALVIGCDSVLWLDDEILGKPSSPSEAAERWRRMRGNSGVLHTGHCVAYDGCERTQGASTVVHFAPVTDAEIDAYVATGEPLNVAGAFTIDGLGGPFVERIEGDHHNVVGLSLPLLRRMLSDLGLAWCDLWSTR